MTLQAACFWSLGFFLVILALGSVIDWLNRRRESDGKRIRDLIQENARLRAQIRHQRFESEWTVDELKTEVAVKELLLNQRWKGATR